MNRLFVVSCAALMAVPAVSSAGITVYRDRTAWEAALATLNTETFNSITADQPFGGSSVTVNTLNLALTNQYPGNGLDAPGNGFAGPTVNGTAQLSFGGSNSPGVQTLTVTGLTASNAVGLDFAGNGRLGSLTLGATTANFDALTTGSFNTASTTTNTFIGIIDTGATYTTFQVRYWPNFGAAAMDNFSWGTAVPAPGAAALLGLGGLTTARRRR